MNAKNDVEVERSRSMSDRKLANCTSSANVTSTPKSVISVLSSTEYAKLVPPSAAATSASKTTERFSDNPW